jgi:hypothetical protein
MHIWTALIAREAALLAILVLLGAGPASFLPDRLDAASRIALSPVLGFCLGTCVTTTLLQFAPTDDTYWALLPLALASAGVGLVRTRGAVDPPPWRRRLPLRDMAALLLIGLAVAGPLTFVLHERHTVGPASYSFTDVDNYVGVQDAARSRSLHEARIAWQEFRHTGHPSANLTQFIWSFIAEFGSNLDATPLDSNMNALLGLGATDTFAPFLTVLLLAGALGAFAAVRYYARSRTWMAALAGGLFGGPMFLELWFDSFQAAIVAIGLLLPYLILVDDALRARRRADIVLIGLVLATLLTVYPLYMALALGAGGLMVLGALVNVRRARGDIRALLAPLAIAILAIGVMVVVFDPVGLTRALRYYPKVANGQVPFPRVSFHLPLSVLPGWLAQTREFWNMPPLEHAAFKEILIGGLLPLLFAGIAVIGLRRYRPAFALVALLVVCAVVAEYAFTSQDACTYCAERNLLPLAPIIVVLTALGLSALLTMSPPWARIMALVGVLVVAVSVGQRARIELVRFANGSSFLDSGNRLVLSRLPPPRTRIQEEGFGASLYAAAEQPLVYHLINERTGGRASIILGSDIGNAIQYLDFGNVFSPPGREFDPGYRYVLTRLASIATERRIVARSGGIALEERGKPLDVIPYSGIATALERVDRLGSAWVQTQYPLRMYVVGRNGGRPAWARLTFRITGPASVPRQSGVKARVAGETITACVLATGGEPVRRVTLRLRGTLSQAKPPPGLFPPVMPFEGVRLTSMQAVTGSCSV